MPTITIDAIALAFRTAINATVPRMQEGQATRTWKYHDDPGAAVRHDSRWYRFEWDGEGPTLDGFMGPLSVDTTTTLSIIVDYGGVPKHRVKILADDDHAQLRDVLNRLKSSATGLRWVEQTTWDLVNTDQNQARVALQFEVRYMKARA